MNVTRKWPSLLLLATGLCLLVAIPFFETKILLALHENLATFAALIERNRILALAIYIAVYVASVAFSFPGAILLTLIGGFGFGALTGGLVAAVSATLGGAIAFLAVRVLSRDWSRRLVGFDLSRMLETLKRDAAAYMLFLRLMPIFPFWLINIAAALAGVTLPTFVWTTFFGVMPGGFAFATAGEALGDMLDRQVRHYDDCVASGAQACRVHLDKAALVDPRLLLALGLIGALALIPVAIRRIAPLERFCERRGWIKPERTRGLR
jgi:uncharacterized membrane protein YdjX (TVP38/TMEM64 family)